MKNLFCLCLLILFISVQVSAQNYTLYLVSQERGAACLDGSPQGLYIHEGSDTQNFIVYFQGGGFCGNGNLSATLESCYKRSNGELGSSKVLASSRSFDSNGILSTNSSLNPNFYNWTKVIVNYCDGAEYYGSRSEPIPYKDKKLYFRGTNNVLETVRYLEEKYDIFNRGKIIVSGKSAGGVATYLYSDLFYEKTLKAKVYALPDSGMFLTDYFSPILQIKTIRYLAQALIDLVWEGNQYPLQGCLQEWKGDVIQCFNAANLIKYRKAPMLMLQSAYDQWSIDNILVARCLTNNQPPFSLENCSSAYLQAINDYRDDSRKAIISMLKQKTNLGVWSPSCVQHGFVNGQSFHDPTYRVPTTVGKEVNDAIMEFLNNPKSPPIYIDAVNWPENSGCSGKSKMTNLRKQWFKLNRLQ